MGMTVRTATLILWHERMRYLPAVVAVGFSALLIAIQSGVLIGTLSFTSIPIDRSRAQIWVGSRDAPSIEMGDAIPEAWLHRLDARPEVIQSERYLYDFAYWTKPGGGSATICVVGFMPGAQSLGAVADLPAAVRDRLAEPGAVVIDASDVKRLGLSRGVGESAEICRQRVRVVGLVEGYQAIWGPYVFCSLETARQLLPQFERNQAMYLLARCRPGTDLSGLANRLRRDHPDMEVFTAAEFSLRTRTYWLTQTQVGTAMGLTTALALLVGLVITSQTLRAAVSASIRELAALRALGIPEWRLGALLLVLSFEIGLGGLLIAAPAMYTLAWAAASIGTKVALDAGLVAATVCLTLGISLLSGVSVLGTLRNIEPVELLR
jgi:putative ABC transport system permease protein